MNLYAPSAFVLDDGADVRALLRHAAFGHLVSHHPDDDRPLRSTPLPFVIDDDIGLARAHVARANPHWQRLDGSQAMLIVPGPDAYVSPRWYPSKQEHQRVVPTWNYSVIHLDVRVRVRHDAEWKRRVVTDLTTRHEAALSELDSQPAWQVTDAPDDFIDRQLGAIVGLSLEIEAWEAKAKLGQNKAASDRRGARDGLLAADDRSRAVGRAMTQDPA